MGHIITIYNHGTADDDKCKESIVTILHDETEKGTQESLKGSQGGLVYRGLNHSVIVTQGVGSELHGSGITGGAFAAGVETNVGPVVELIETLVKDGLQIDCINM